MAPGAHLALVFVLTGAAPSGQPAAPAPSTDAVSLERIRRELAKGDPLTTASAGPSTTPVFRIRIEELVPRYVWLAWDPARDTAVPSYVRPRVPLAHYEYLRMTTPEAFRASTLYPAGTDLLGPSQSLIGGIRDWLHRREAEAARRRIKEELEAIRKAQGIP